MIKLKKILLSLFLCFIIQYIYSYDSTSDLVVDKIHTTLINQYSNFKERTFWERVVLQLGKSAFIDNVKIWKDNYKNLDNIKITIHPKMEDMAKITDKYLDYETSKRFRSLLIDLTRIAFENLQLYYNSTDEYLKNNNLNYNDINIGIIDDAQCNLKYFEQKKSLYEKEDGIKKSLREIMEDKRVKYKLGIYIFAFDFFNKIRNGIIKKDMDKMLAKINKK